MGDLYSRDNEFLRRNSKEIVDRIKELDDDARIVLARFAEPFACQAEHNQLLPALFYEVPSYRRDQQVKEYLVDLGILKFVKRTVYLDGTDVAIPHERVEEAIINLLGGEERHELCDLAERIKSERARVKNTECEIEKLKHLKIAYGLLASEGLDYERIHKTMPRFIDEALRVYETEFSGLGFLTALPNDDVGVILANRSTYPEPNHGANCFVDITAYRDGKTATKSFRWRHDTHSHYDEPRNLFYKVKISNVDGDGINIRLTSKLGHKDQRFDLAK